MAMNYTPIPLEFLEEMEELSDAEYGRLIRWGQRYHLTGAASKLSGNERFYAKRMQMQIDRYVNHYNDVSESRKAARASKQTTTNVESAYPQMSTNDDNCGETKTKTNTNTETYTDTSSAIAERSNSAQARFVPPTIEEVAAYVAEKSLDMDPDAFCDFYASKGWKVGNQPMKDWKAAARNWARSDREGSRGKPKPAPPDKPRDERSTIDQMRKLREKINAQQQ